MSAKEERGYYCLGYAAKQQTNLCFFKYLHFEQGWLLKLFLIVVVAIMIKLVTMAIQ